MVVNSSWLQLLSQNAVWKPLCKMALRQNRDPAAVTNFKSKVRRLASWRHAYLRIPQVRFTGVYSLEHSYVRQGIRDIWHDFEGILQVNYQRTVWFHNGTSNVARLDSTMAIVGPKSVYFEARGMCVLTQHVPLAPAGPSRQRLAALWVSNTAHNLLLQPQTVYSSIRLRSVRSSLGSGLLQTAPATTSWCRAGWRTASDTYGPCTGQNTSRRDTGDWKIALSSSMYVHSLSHEPCHVSCTGPG